MNTMANSEFAGPEWTDLTVAKQAPNFDRLAKVYRWMELLTFGPLLARCRNAFLLELVTARRALILGDGDGRFTAKLLRVNSLVRIDAVDSSPAMLGALLHRAGANGGRITLHCADARGWQPENEQYDLVATHFFLDCLTTEECYGLAARLRSTVCPSAVWIVSEFAVPEGWFGEFVARPLIWLLYRAFGVLTELTIRNLPDHHAAFRDAGFALAGHRTRLHGLLVSEMWNPKA
jgi:SAM-dependent methyltransferase